MPKRFLALDLATGIPDAALHRAVTFDASAGNVTMPAGTTVYRTVAGPLITAARTLTLAAASSYAPGQRIVIADSGVNLDGATGSLALTPAGADTISASLTLIISLYGGYVELVSDGVSRFDLAAASLDVLETAIGVILNQQPSFNSGANAPNQGTTWGAIGGSELVTKAAVEVAAGLEVRLLLTSDVALTSATLATAASATLPAGLWEIEGYIPFTVSAGTPGIKVSILPAGTVTAGYAMFDVFNTNAAVAGVSMALPISPYGSNALTDGHDTGVSTAGYHSCVRIRGVIKMATSNTVALQLAQNTASNTTTAKAYGWVLFRKLSD